MDGKPSSLVDRLAEVVMNKISIAGGSAVRIRDSDLLNEAFGFKAFTCMGVDVRGRYTRVLAWNHLEPRVVSPSMFATFGAMALFVFDSPTGAESFFEIDTFSHGLLLPWSKLPGLTAKKWFAFRRANT